MTQTIINFLLGNFESCAGPDECLLHAAFRALVRPKIENGHADSQRIYCGKYGNRHATHKHGKLLKTNVFISMKRGAAKSVAVNMRVVGF